MPTQTERESTVTVKSPKLPLNKFYSVAIKRNDPSGNREVIYLTQDELDELARQISKFRSE